MAVKALASWEGHTIDPNSNSEVQANVRITVVGSDIGDLEERTYFINVGGLNPSNLGLANQEIAAAVKADMEDHEITFGMLDTVAVRG